MSAHRAYHLGVPPRSTMDAGLHARLLSAYILYRVAAITQDARVNFLRGSPAGTARDKGLDNSHLSLLSNLTPLSV